jgi:hypothetical protein
MMDVAEVALRSVLDRNGWALPVRPPARLEDFAVVGESPVSVLFAARTTASALPVDAARLAGVISAAVLSRGGPKVWEAILVLLVSGIRKDDEHKIAAVERDLTYCRKVVVDSASIEESSDPEKKMEAQLSFLFPLSALPTESDRGPLGHLEAHLAELGYAQQFVEALIADFETNEGEALRIVDDYVATSMQ